MPEVQEYFERLAQSVIDGEEEDCIRSINEGLSVGMNPLDAVEKGLAKGIKKVGEDFAAQVVFLPELVIAADVMKVGLAILDEEMKKSGDKRKSLARVVIGTIKGDIHDIGKSVVAAIFQSNGYDVFDLGTDVDPEAFINALREHDANVLGMSTLLTLPLAVMGEVIEKLKDEGMRNNTKVIVGGCPVTQEFADEIGADAVGFDALDGLKKLDALLGVKRREKETQ